MQRRHFLKNTMATGAVALAASSGLLIPGRVLAAWNKGAFDAKDDQSAMKSAVGTVTSITLLSEKNATPLVAKFNLKGQAEAFVSTRIKMGKTSNVIAVCESGGKFYSTRKEVKVTIGGCGG